MVTHQGPTGPQIGIVSVELAPSDEMPILLWDTIWNYKYDCWAIQYVYKHSSCIKKLTIGVVVIYIVRQHMRRACLSRWPNNGNVSKFRLDYNVKHKLDTTNGSSCLHNNGATMELAQLIELYRLCGHWFRTHTGTHAHRSASYPWSWCHLTRCRFGCEIPFGIISMIAGQVRR